jgi:ribokinase
VGGLGVVGSVVEDIIVNVPSLPTSGQTIRVLDVSCTVGGRGARQAIEAQRISAALGLSTSVHLLSLVGDDERGARVRGLIAALGIDVSCFSRKTSARTGICVALVEPDGENTLLYAPGAEVHLCVSDVDAFFERATSLSHLIVSLDCDSAIAEEAVDRARDAGIVVILDPAPADRATPRLLSGVDILLPNVSEARWLLKLGGARISSAEAPAICERLSSLGPRSVVLKLGREGAWAFHQGRHLPILSESSSAIDTLGTGDVVAGALGALLSAATDFEPAVSLAISRASDSSAISSVARSLRTEN